MLTITPNFAQERALNMLRRDWKSHNTFMVYAPTGSGKTGLAAFIVDGFVSRGMRVLFCAPYTILIGQTANHPLQNMITRAVITAIDTVRKCQTAGLKLIAGEKKENVEHLEPYGFTSAAQNGAEAVVLFPGGDRSHGVAVVVADRRFRLKGLARGEVALYDDQGQSVTLTRAGIVINGCGKPVIFTNATKARFEMPIESTGDIRDNCDSSGKTMAEMRTTYNGHTHKENGDGGGITDKPVQPMS